MSIRSAVQRVFDRVRYNRAVEKVKRPYEKTGETFVSTGPVIDMIFRHITYAVLSMFFVLLAAYLAIWALSGPDVMPHTIANILAQVCTKTGECRFHVLLPGFALGNIILIYLAIFFLWMVGDWTTTEKNSDDTFAALNTIVHTLDDHTDFLNDIQYKIIQLSRGEEVAPVMIEPKLPPDLDRKNVYQKLNTYIFWLVTGILTMMAIVLLVVL